MSTVELKIAHHVDKIVLRPVQKGDERFYVASGEWSLRGGEKGRVHCGTSGLRVEHITARNPLETADLAMESLQSDPNP